ncbi:hypothetical protein KHC28_08810 [Ancylobacter sonchi]|uniref:hypothetical protein n=1 Tax=Ancylobacter sonchi TaxID=1937790 RepID=UPI001BD25911|nr:hypothetical protein [Ancylobacter sonchi]MBS7533756.1 hypothetical protein [Ancylobacter sonchi]
MSDEIFADGFGDISVTGSTIRIDLVSQSPTERDANGQPVPRFRQRVVLPVEGFLRAQEMMQRMLDVLIQQGIVKREPAPAGLPETVVAAPKPAGNGDASPNFPVP